MQLLTLLNRVQDEYPGVPVFLALRALSDAVKEFCARTHIWREDITTSHAEGSAKYLLAPGAGRMVVAPKVVKIGGKRLDPVVPYDPRMDRHDGEPRVYAQITPSLIELDHAAMAGAELTVNAALTLTQGETETEIPNDLIDEYGEAIAAGAKMRLTRMAGQSWFNPDTAGAYAGQYYSAITAAKGRAMSALGEADMTVEMRSW